MLETKEGETLVPRAMRGKRRSRLVRRMIWVVLACFAALAIWCAVLYFRIVSFDGVPGQEKTVNADVGIVLGAKLWDDKPSPGLRERLDYALQLYDQGAFKRFIVTGGLDAGGAKVTEAQGMRDYLVDRGVPEDAVEMDALSRSTYENLLFAKDIMREKGWASAVIVTHSYHGARAADIADKLGYAPIQVRVTDSKVLKISYHEAREVLAFTKWLVEKTFR